MPYRSAKQRRYMHAKHPEIAARWDAEYGGKVKEKKRGRASTRLRGKRGRP
jgi:hypothetical protein